MTVDKIILGYWSTKGLGSTSRQMIIYAGVPLISKIYRLIPKLEKNSLTYDGCEWHDKDKIILFITTLILIFFGNVSTQDF